MERKGEARLRDNAREGWRGNELPTNQRKEEEKEDFGY